jgi:hypothetical protein
MALCLSCCWATCGCNKREHDVRWWFVVLGDMSSRKVLVRKLMFLSLPSVLHESQC